MILEHFVSQLIDHQFLFSIQWKSLGDEGQPEQNEQ